MTNLIDLRIGALLIALVAVLPLRAEVAYLNPQGDVVPAGKVMAVEARASVAKGGIGSSKPRRWSINWSGVSVVLEFDLSSYVDGIDNPRLNVECNGEKVSVTKGVNFAGGFNSVAIEWASNGSATVSVGEYGLTEVLRFDSLPMPADSIRIAGSSPMVDCLVVETDNRDFGRLQTAYSQAELNSAIRWRYLDKENNPDLALSGGEYVLAQIGNDLVYVSGAKTNAEQWKSGMLKARLTATGYSGYYKVDWYDSTGKLIPDESYAELNATAKTMKITFPKLQTSLRFTSLN